MSTVGMYVGYLGSDLDATKTWLGRDLDYLAIHTGRASWWDWTSSISWEAQQFSQTGATLTWTIPMFADGGTLAAAASGAYNNYYLQAAQTLASTYANQDVIYVRVGEEFNGTWMPWAAAGHEQDFVQAYINFVDTFRTVSDKFRFEWNVTIGQENVMDPAKAYPGDAYVDIVGMDFYYNTAWDNPDPTQAWDYNVIRPYGLQWLEDFAAAHSKQTAYSEWGVTSDNAAAYITHAAAWFATHNVAYQIYWNSDLDPSMQTELNDRPTSSTAQAYLDAFAAPVPTVVPAAPVLNLTNDTGLPDGITKDAALTITGVETGATLTYTVDGAGVASYDPTKLIDGTHTVSVTQTDAAGNASAAGAITFTLDTQALAPTPALTSDTGSSNQDRITNRGSLTMTGVEAGATLSYIVDGVSVASYDPANLADGTHTVSVTQTDIAGNVSAAGTLSFTLDTKALAPALALASDTGSSNQDGISKNAALTIGGVEAGATLGYIIDGVTAASYDPTKLADGNHTVSVTQTDIAGNTSAAGTLSFTLDTKAQAPVLTLTSDTGSSNQDGITKSGALTVTGVKSGAMLKYIVDGVSVASYDPAKLADGKHVVSVTQTDLAGNTSAAGSLSFTLDTKAAQAPGLALSSDAGLSNKDGITKNAALTVTGIETGATLNYLVDGVSVASYDPTKLADGKHTISITQTDVAGNSSAAASLNFTLDASPPLAFNIDVVKSGPTKYTFSWSDKDNTGGSGLEHFEWWMDTGVHTKMAPVDNATVTLTSKLKPGDHTFHVDAFDVAGNVVHSTYLLHV